jgi:hypothetical protein
MSGRGSCEVFDLPRGYAAFLNAGLSWDWEGPAAYAAALEGLPLGCNVALQVGHGAVRIVTMGFDNRQPSAAELATMQWTGTTGAGSSSRWASWIGPAPAGRASSPISIHTSSMCEEDIRRVMTHPAVAIASDGSCTQLGCRGKEPNPHEASPAGF